ncbi:hypothetical protein M3Y98_00689700 [Aphelenchoides besseyi]|nr:hypothetical protein M3Y98_00689700 [Aphelenchoides besseyi]
MVSLVPSFEFADMTLQIACNYSDLCIYHWNGPGIIVQFRVWFENSMGVRTQKIDDIFFMTCGYEGHVHGFETKYLRPLLGSDQLFVCCDAMLWVEKSNKAEGISAIAEFYGDNEMADTEIRVDKQTFKASKAILAAHSVMFDGLTEVDDVDVEMFDLMIRFMYSNRVENLDAVASRLLVVADRFKIDQLIEICINSLLENMNTANIT